MSECDENVAAYLSSLRIEMSEVMQEKLYQLMDCDISAAKELYENPLIYCRGYYAAIQYIDDTLRRKIKYG